MLSAALLYLSFPPADLWPLAWIAPVGWVLLIRKEELPGRRPYLAIWAAGFLFWLGVYWWLCLPHWATSFGWVAVSFYFAFYLPVFVGFSRVAVHRLRLPVILAAPVVWTGLELARGHLLTGITMASLGHTQYRWIELIQMSDLAGAYGVGFVVMFVAACLARMLPCDGSGWSTRPLVPLVAVLGAVLGYGHVRIERRSAARRRARRAQPAIRVALIQGSIDIDVQRAARTRAKVVREHYCDLTSRGRCASIGRARPDGLAGDDVPRPAGHLSTPTPPCPPTTTKSAAAFREELSRVLRKACASRQRLGAGCSIAPLLLGVDTWHFRAGRRAAATTRPCYVDRDGELLGRYDKMHLVMFGEYVPFADWFPWLQRLHAAAGRASTAGAKPAAFDARRRAALAEHLLRDACCRT